MHNHDPLDQLHEIGVSQKNINVYFVDRPRDGTVFVLPPAEKLYQSKNQDIQPASLREFPTLGTTNFSEYYDLELSKLRSKYDRFESSYTYMNHLARLSYLAGHIEDAKVYLNTAIQLNEDAHLRIELVSILIEKDEDDQAMELLSESNTDSDLEANLALAHLMIRSGDLEQARKHVDNALSIDISDYGALMFRGAIHLYEKEWELAIRRFRSAAESKDYSSTLYTNLAAAYWGIGQKEKTVYTLRKSIYLDPMNENAILFLSDVLSMMGMPERCISPLEVFLTYKQDNEALWARAARAYYELGKEMPSNKSVLRKSLEALSIQSNLEDTSDVKNNMGVVYSALGNRIKAHRCFADALARARQLGEDDGIPFSNFIGEFIRIEKFDKAYNLAREYLASKTDDVYPKIYVQYINSMDELGMRNEAALKAMDILDSDIKDNEVRLDLLAYLFYNKSFIEPDADTIMRYLPKFREIIVQGENLPDKLRCRATNNLVFALLQIGNFVESTQLLDALSRWVHIDPFATATLGLYQLIKGRVDRAINYYREAISLESDSVLKERIRQRMNFEIGRHYSHQGDRGLAVKFLRRALKQRKGYDHLKQETKRLLVTLREGGQLQSR